MKQSPKHTAEELRQLQHLPLDAKIAMSRERIREWIREFGESGVYVSFSGGKDSTVLLHLVRQWYPDVTAVFVDTGLEYPEIRQFVKTFDNVEIIRPAMNFKQVITKYGYPVIVKEIARKISAYRNGKKWSIRFVEGTAKMSNGKKSYYCCEKYKPVAECDFLVTNYCCNVMKKEPFMIYDKKTGKVPITAEMADESLNRKAQWLKNGCNVFDGTVIKSKPMSFWTEQDVLQYIIKNNLTIAPPYGEITLKGNTQLSFFDEPCQQCKLCTTGLSRTGCIFCGFGAHLEKGETRFQRLKRTHPRHYEYCIYGGAYDSDGLWKPDKNGLGMYHVFDELNKLYGENFIRYK